MKTSRRIVSSSSAPWSRHGAMQRCNHCPSPHTAHPGWRCRTFTRNLLVTFWSEWVGSNCMHGWRRHDVWSFVTSLCAVSSLSVQECELCRHKGPASQIVTPAVTTNTGTQHNYPEYPRICRYCRYLDIVDTVPGRDPLVRRAGGGARGGAGGGAGARLHQRPALALGAARHRDRAQVPPCIPCILGSAADDPSGSQSVFIITEKAPTRDTIKTLC